MLEVFIIFLLFVMAIIICTNNKCYCRVASVSKQSEANDRGVFELPLYLQYIQCKLQNTIVNTAQVAIYTTNLNK